MKDFVLRVTQYCKTYLSPSYLWGAFKANFSIWNVLNIQTALKVAFLYSVAVLCIIVSDFHLPNPKYRGDNVISVYSAPRIGEGLLQDRIVEEEEKIA